MIYQVLPLQMKVMVSLDLVLIIQPIDQHAKVNSQMILLQQAFMMINTDQLTKWLPGMVVYLIY